MRELWRSIAHTSAAKVVSVLASAGIVAITARSLGPEGRGQLAVVTSWAIALTTLMHLSLGQVALHRASRRSAGYLSEAVSVLFVWCIVATLTGWTLVGSLHKLTDGRLFGDIPSWVLALGFLSLPLLIWEQYSTSLLMATNRLSTANRYQVFGRVAALIGVAFTAWMLSGSLLSVLFCTLLGQLVVALAGFREFRVHFQLGEIGKRLSSFLSSGFRLHLNAIGTFLLASLDIAILNYYSGARETGYYQLGLQLITVMGILPTAVASVFYAKVAQDGPDKAWQQQRRVLVYIVATMIVGALVAGVLAKPLVLLLGGSGFLPTVEVFRWQLVSLLGITISAVMAPQWIGRGLFVLASLITLIFGVANVSMMIWLVPTFGKLGAAWASGITYCIAIISNGVFAIWCSREARQVLGKVSKE